MTQDPLVALRRDLHAHPELRFQEHRTVTQISAALQGHADELTVVTGGTGLIARVDGALEGPVVLVRADIDAYPVADAKDVAYSSTVPGVTHACGHDVHAAVGAGVIQRFAADRDFAGSVVVAFQPAEEIPFGEASGAAAILAEPALRDLRCSAVLGVHCWPQLTAGRVGVEHRIAMAAKDAFEVTISGASAHAATPASGRDAILAASSLVSALHGVVARRRDPHEQLAFNIGTISGGTSQSALATRVTVTGTIRTHEPDVRARLRETIETVVAGTGMQHETPMQLRWANEMPAVVNDPALVSLVREIGTEVAEIVDLEAAPLTTDDFALYAELAPTLYLKLGVAEPGTHAWPSLHSADFDVDESCIGVGVDTLCRLAQEILIRSQLGVTTA